MTVTSQPRTESSHAAVSPNTPAPTMTIERVSAMIDHDHRPVFPDLLTELESRPPSPSASPMSNNRRSEAQEIRHQNLYRTTTPYLLIVCSNVLRSVNRRSKDREIRRQNLYRTTTPDLLIFCNNADLLVARLRVRNAPCPRSHSPHLHSPGASRSSQAPLAGPAAAPR